MPFRPEKNGFRVGGNRKLFSCSKSHGGTICNLWNLAILAGFLGDSGTSLVERTKRHIFLHKSCSPGTYQSQGPRESRSHF